MKTQSSNDHTTAPTTQTEAAFERVQHEIDAVDLASAPPPNVDLYGAANIALGSLPAIHADLDALARLEGLDIDAVRHLEDYALATKCAQARYAIAGVPPEALPALVDEGIALRDKLRDTGLALVKWGLIPANKFATVSGGRGFKTVADDLLTVGLVFEEAEATVHGKSPVTRAEVDRAIQLSEQISALIARRDRQSESVGHAAATRRKTFWLLERAYDEARRGMTFLHWRESNVDELLPPLRTHAGPARRTAADASDDDEARTPGGDGGAAVVQDTPVPAEIAQTKPFAT